MGKKVIILWELTTQTLYDVSCKSSKQSLDRLLQDEMRFKKFFMSNQMRIQRTQRRTRRRMKRMKTQRKRMRMRRRRIRSN